MSNLDETTINIPKAFNLEFINGRKQKILLYMFPFSHLVCSKCDYVQDMLYKKNMLKIIEYHAIDCEYNE